MVLPARIQCKCRQDLQISELKLQDVNRTSLMDRKLENIKWKKNKASGTPFSGTNKNIDQGIGSSLPWYLNREERNFDINILDLIEAKTAILIFTKRGSSIVKQTTVRYKQGNLK